jgi:superfamily I DNA/RNA helicase
MHACKGLEFPVVALSGLGQMPAAREDEHEEARLFYVAATRATQRLVITVSGDGGFGKRLCVTGLPENEPAARSVQSESKAKLPFNL